MPQRRLNISPRCILRTYIRQILRPNPGREIKNAANELVREGKLEFFSSGSTVMYGVPGYGKGVEEAFEEGEE